VGVWPVLELISRALVATGRVAMCVHEGIVRGFLIVGVCTILALPATAYVSERLVKVADRMRSQARRKADQ
jgi:hypothetical protein